MGFFNKPDQQADIQTNSTVISNGTKITGAITTKCALHLDGTHSGEIESVGHVTIGTSGKVEGEIVANTLAITGSFTGTADCEKVEVLAGGNVKGKIITSNLSIDHDCNFEGESIKRPPKSVTTNQFANKSPKKVSPP